VAILFAPDRKWELAELLARVQTGESIREFTLGEFAERHHVYVSITTHRCSVTPAGARSFSHRT